MKRAVAVLPRTVVPAERPNLQKERCMNSGIWVRGALAAVLFLPFAATAQDARPTHPLDALTGSEIHQVKELLKADGKLGPTARFHAVDLDEPEKTAVLAWRPGT